jgi:hypothetical protein
MKMTILTLAAIASLATSLHAGELSDEVKGDISDISHGRAEEISGIHHSGTIAEADTRALMYFVLEADKLGIQQHAPFLIDCINEYNNDMDGRLDAVRAKKSREFMNEMADALRGK